MEEPWHLLSTGREPESFTRHQLWDGTATVDRAERQLSMVGSRIDAWAVSTEREGKLVIEVATAAARPVLPRFRLVKGQPPCLLLGDVDHTLIANEGVSKEIYAAAFRRLTGQESLHRARTEGRTDPQIMEGMLTHHGIDPSEDFGRRLHEALASAGREKAARLHERGRALPGAAEALKVLGYMDG